MGWDVKPWAGAARRRCARSKLNRPGARTAEPSAGAAGPGGFCAVISRRARTPYRIFFDETEIKVGRQWKTEIELALLGTRCFLPVYSERYFGRPYCREEIEIADQLRIEGRLRMFPVALTVDGVPERCLRKVQYIDARANVALMDDLITQIVDRGAVPSQGPV